MPKKRSYWLFKSEPDAYSIDDLAAEKDRTTCWDGVRNYQARNLLRDDIKKGDKVLFYHSNAKPPAAVGIAEVVREGYPDHTAWENAPGTKGHDPKSDPENPTWIMVDIALEEIFSTPVPLTEIKATEGLEDMELARKGSRLSIQPVTAAEWKIVTRLGRRKPK